MVKNQKNYCRFSWNNHGIEYLWWFITLKVTVGLHHKCKAV